MASVSLTMVKACWKADEMGAEVKLKFDRGVDDLNRALEKMTREMKVGKLVSFMRMESKSDNDEEGLQGRMATRCRCVGREGQTRRSSR